MKNLLNVLVPFEKPLLPNPAQTINNPQLLIKMYHTLIINPAQTFNNSFTYHFLLDNIRPRYNTAPRSTYTK